MGGGSCCGRVPDLLRCWRSANARYLSGTLQRVAVAAAAAAALGRFNRKLCVRVCVTRSVACCSGCDEIVKGPGAHVRNYNRISVKYVLSI